MSPSPRLRWASDRALLVELAPEGALSPSEIETANRRAVTVAARVAAAALAGILDVQPAYATVLVTLDLGHADADRLEAALRAMLAVGDGGDPAADAVAASAREEVLEPLEIPTCYDPAVAPDLADVAAHAGLASEDVVRRHAAAVYRVLFLGFAPGFGYLGGLPPELATPRLAEPRRRVEAGSVAIGGAQAAVYPLASPAGWRIVGRTPLRLFDPRRTPMSLLAPGRAVRFRAISAARLAELGEPGELVMPAPGARDAVGPAPAAATAWLEVLEPGLLTTVQDLGRPGHAHLGVSPCGAADPLSLRVGNRLLGNDEGAAALELTLVGGHFRVAAARRCVLAGSDFAATLEPHGVALAPWLPFTLAAGDSVRLAASRQGARCYLCVDGGVDVDAVLGSRATHLPSGLGGFHGRALRRGDAVPLAPRETAPGTQTDPGQGTGAGDAVRELAAELARTLFRRELRVVRGAQADWFAPDALADLARHEHEVSERSDRLGLRLAGPSIALSVPRELLTEGAPWGALQVPPGGQPILLGVDQQTTGGYPKLANVVAADLPALGQLRPRDRVRFREVALGEARALLRAQEALLHAATEVAAAAGPRPG